MEAFDFRNIIPGVDFGTASDRYGGWLGQIYTPAKYEGTLTTRKRRLGDEVYEEQVLPVESVREFFRHFSVLEIDFTFYRLLLDREGGSTETCRVLQAYAAHLKSGNRIFLKVPQVVTARKIFRRHSFVANDRYLDPGIFTERFFEPAAAILGDALAGFVFEQEYQRAKEREEPDELAAELDDFFDALPEDRRYHLELRTEKYLAPPLFRVMEKHGVGQVLSHWTWLPSLEEQFRRSGERVLNGGGTCLIRLLTPRHRRYEESYALAFPFNRLDETMISPGMIEDTIAITRKVIEEGRQVTVIVNNRAGGNAPLLARLIADRYARLEGE